MNGATLFRASTQLPLLPSAAPLSVRFIAFPSIMHQRPRSLRHPREVCPKALQFGCGKIFGAFGIGIPDSCEDVFGDENGNFVGKKPQEPSRLVDRQARGGLLDHAQELEPLGIHGGFLVLCYEITIVERLAILIKAYFGRTVPGHTKPYLGIPARSIHSAKVANSFACAKIAAMGARIQKTVKVSLETDARIQEITALLGYTEHQFLVQSVKGIVTMIDTPNRLVVPRVVWLAHCAKAYNSAPPLLPCGPSPVGRMSWW